MIKLDTLQLDELRGRIGYQSAILGAVALLASAALAIAYSGTHEAIRAAEERDLVQSLQQVLPAGFADNDLLRDRVTLQRADGSAVEIYRARRAGAFVGAVFQVASRGYAADVVSLLGVDAEGTVLGVRVIKHTETPGLGDKIEVAKSPWIKGFDGKSLAGAKWAVKKDGGEFDQFAGATITPRAVVKSVADGLAFYAEHRGEIAAPLVVKEGS